MKNFKMAHLRMWAILAMVLVPGLSHGRLLQILHTNDTHSFFDGIAHSTAKGGMARLKGLIDEYKKKMEAEGVKTLVLDAGDFSEGNIYYMAQNGRKSFEIQNEMGYDIGTLGNHDYLMGIPELDKLLGEMNLKFSIVAANLEVHPKYKNLNSKIIPFKEIDIDGVKIAILGITSDEFFYKWRVEEGAIKDPIRTAVLYEKVLKERKNDYIIALTHLGVLRDLKLSQKTKDIDLIVGGHSHTTLFKPRYGINERHKEVPIVQAGMHTEYLGRIIVDVEKGKPLKIVKYELVPVNGDKFIDERIKNIVEEADSDLNSLYGKEWLDEVVGYSDLTAADPKGANKWSYFIADALKEKANTDIAIHSAEMNGDNYPIGNISRRAIINSFPRIFDVYDHFGWTIYTTKVKGIWLRLTVDALAHFGQPLTFSGLKMDYEKSPLGFKIRTILVNGKRINPFRTYTVAMSEGVVRGAEGFNSKTVAILRSPNNTTYRIWETLEEKIRKMKPDSSIKNISTNNHTIFDF